MPRLRFVLFFTEDPPAVDILREDSFQPFNNTVVKGQVWDAVLNKDTVTGEILQIGESSSYFISSFSTPPALKISKYFTRSLKIYRDLFIS